MSELYALFQVTLAWQLKFSEIVLRVYGILRKPENSALVTQYNLHFRLLLDRKYSFA